MDILPATEDDIQFMFDLDVRYFHEYLVALDGKFNEEQWYGYLRKDLPRAYLLSDEGNKVGYFRYSLKQNNEGPGIVLRVLAIHPDWRGKGYGKALYQYFEELVKKTNSNQIELSCPVTSESINWYPKLGFELIKRDELAWHFQKKLGH